MIFGFKDSLRQAVEAASGGQATVMYTPKGQPIFMRRITPFRLEDLAPDGSLGTGWHPAFPDGREFWVSIHRVAVIDNEPISIPGVALSARNPSAWLTTPYPPGMRPIYLQEYAALALIGTKLLGDVLRGNDSRGRNATYPWETGVRTDGNPPGSSPGGWTLTGSGPVTWRHDHTPFGVELVGNADLWLPNLRFKDGQIQLRPLTAPLVDPSSSPDSDWLAIAPDGSLVPATNTTTLGYMPGNKIGTGRVSGADLFFTFASLTADTGLSIPPIMRALGLAPSLYTRGSGLLYHSSSTYLGGHVGGRNDFGPAAPGTVRGMWATFPGNILVVYRE